MNQRRNRINNRLPTRHIPSQIEMLNEYIFFYQLEDLYPINRPSYVALSDPNPNLQLEYQPIAIQQGAPRWENDDRADLHLFRDTERPAPDESGHEQSSAGDVSAIPIAGSSNKSVTQHRIEDTFHGSFEPESVFKYPYTAEGAEDEKMLGEIDLGENWPKIAEFMNEDGSIDTKGFWEAAPKDELERVIDSALGFVKSDFGRRFNFVLPSKKEFFEKWAGKKEDKLGHGLAINPIADSSASTSNAIKR